MVPWCPMETPLAWACEWALWWLAVERVIRLRGSMDRGRVREVVAEATAFEEKKRKNYFHKNIGWPRIKCKSVKLEAVEKKQWANSRGGIFDLSISMATILMTMIQMGQLRMSVSAEPPKLMTEMHWASSLRRSG